jgi:RNA polymerase sigma-70 factor (ECF subfamily)
MAITDAASLFVAHHARLFKYFRRAVNDAEAARDLTQEVFLRVTRTTIPQAANRNVAPWLFRIARNLALDYHRNRRRRPQLAELMDTAGRSSSQDVDLAVGQALAALSDVDRDVFVMREVAGLSYEEIAAVYGETACHPRYCGMLSAPQRLARRSTSWPRTTCGAHAPSLPPRGR